MNESEFQNRVNDILSKLLPTFSKAEIRCQRNFSIKFGHHNVIVDGKEPTKYAKRSIYDLLIYINEEPIILLELKKPGLPLTNEDIKQGISYARLTDKITPITIVTNGIDHIIYDTIKNEPFSVSQIDRGFLDLVKTNLSIAADEMRNSIETIIQNDQGVLFEIINSISANSFDKLTGTVNQFDKPIINSFCVPRSVLSDLTLKVETDKFILLTGDAFVGKTTLIYQFFKSEKEKGNATLYIDCQDIFYSLFRKLSHFLSGSLSYPIDDTKVREWLLSSFHTQGTKKINVIFDSLRIEGDPDISRHIIELKDIFQFSEQRIILCTDTSNYRYLVKHPDRNSLTLIGKEFIRQKVSNFTTDEYFKANDFLQEKYSLGILRGGVYAREFRTPRIWRLIISDALKEKPSEGAMGYIDSIPSIAFLDLFTNSIQFDYQTVIDFRKFTQVFVESIATLKDKPELRLMAYNLGIVEESFADQFLDEKLIKRLLNAGFIEKRPVGDYKWVYVPKLPELIAGYSIEYLKEKFIPLFKSSLDVAYSTFLETCEYFPYGEMVAARVLFDIGNSENEMVFSQIINKLIKDEPTVEETDSEKMLGMYYEGIGDITIKSGEGIQDKFFGNAFPFLVLAHLTYMNFGDYSDDPHLIRFQVIGKLGNSKIVQRRADHIFFHSGIVMLESEELGAFVDTKIGIVEPIVLSMKANLMHYPEHFEKLFKAAKINKLFPLLHRMYIAAINSYEFSNSKVDNICEEIIKEYENDLLYRMFAYADLGLDVSRAEFRRLYKRYRKFAKK